MRLQSLQYIEIRSSYYIHKRSQQNVQREAVFDRMPMEENAFPSSSDSNVL